MTEKKLSRYTTNADAKVDDRVLFDNSNGYNKELPVGLLAGTVTGTDGESDVKVFFKLRTGEELELNIHYLLLK